ncbi:hypothetical protein HRI_003872000 [Hibiscus trionum]|uniref:Uncharacterized protein n=1 Tax=Hibiscus trionum TaxID=183268 RepID=A0A9W7ISW7_HIBTR|nr:hypothetical protein HRI_003872000 [Hibiscus trionum]
MDDKNGLVDVSRFFLVEHSGDSEVDSESSMDITTSTTGGGVDDDDAESCSCDAICTERLDDFYEVILRLLDDDGGDEDLIDCNDEDRDQDGEEPGLGIDLCREVMDRMEDRLFWETCMAVGYP